MTNLMMQETSTDPDLIAPLQCLPFHQGDNLHEMSNLAKLRNIFQNVVY